MARQNLNNGESGLVFRNKLNDNFIELYKIASVFATTVREASDTFTIDTTPTTIPFSDTVKYENEVTYDPSTGIFENVYKGEYDISFFFSGNWGNNIEIFFTLWVGGVQQGAGIALTGLGAGKNIPLGIPSFASMGSNDTLEIKAHIATGTTELEIVSGSVGLDLKVITE